MQIDPKVGVWFQGIMTAVGLVGYGVVNFTGLLPDPIAHKVVGWCLVAFTIYGGVGTSLHLWSAPTPGPWAAPSPPAPTASPPKSLIVFALLTLAVVLLILSARGRAEARPLHAHRFMARSSLQLPIPLPAPKPLSLGGAVTSVDSVVANLEKLTLQDATYAAYLAQLAGDTNVETCAEGIVNLVNDLQPPAPRPDAPAMPPEPALITKFAKIHIIARQIRAAGPLQNACAALGAELKMDALSAINAVATGTLSFTTLGAFFGL